MRSLSTSDLSLSYSAEDLTKSCRDGLLSDVVFLCQMLFFVFVGCCYLWSDAGLMLSNFLFIFVCQMLYFLLSAVVFCCRMLLDVGFLLSDVGFCCCQMLFLLLSDIVLCCQMYS